MLLKQRKTAATLASVLGTVSIGVVSVGNQVIAANADSVNNANTDSQTSASNADTTQSSAASSSSASSDASLATPGTTSNGDGTYNIKTQPSDTDDANDVAANQTTSSASTTPASASDSTTSSAADNSQSGNYQTVTVQPDGVATNALAQAKANGVNVTFNVSVTNGFKMDSNGNGINVAVTPNKDGSFQVTNADPSKLTAVATYTLDNGQVITGHVVNGVMTSTVSDGSNTSSAASSSATASDVVASSATSSVSSDASSASSSTSSSATNSSTSSDAPSASDSSAASVDITTPSNNNAATLGDVSVTPDKTLTDIIKLANEKKVQGSMKATITSGIKNDGSAVVTVGADGTVKVTNADQSKLGGYLETELSNGMKLKSTIEGGKMTKTDVVTPAKDASTNKTTTKKATTAKAGETKASTTKKKADTGKSNNSEYASNGAVKRDGGSSSDSSDGSTGSDNASSSGSDNASSSGSGTSLPKTGAEFSAILPAIGFGLIGAMGIAGVATKRRREAK